MRRLILIMSISALFFGCAPKAFTPYKPPPIEFEKTPEYDFDDSKIAKPKKPIRIYLDRNFKPIEDKDKASYVAFAPREYAKIVALNRLFNAQSEIIKEHVKVINANIETINALKELIAIKEAQVNEYIALWANAENAYREEKYRHSLDNGINRTAMYLISIGSIILLAIGL